MVENSIASLVNGNKISKDECFNLFHDLCNKLNSDKEEEKAEARKDIILVLDNLERIPKEYHDLFSDLVSAAGFYPYVNRVRHYEESFDESIRITYHQSENDKKIFFHSEQKKIFNLIMQHKNVIVSAPTSFGKSLLIEEIVASKEYRNIVIIQPTLALLDETRRNLKKYADDYKIIVRTSQLPAEDKGNIFLLTAERVVEYPNLPEIQFFILDEFYKLSSQREDDRNNILNVAFIRLMKNPDCKFYMLGPNIDSIPDGFAEKYDAIFYKTDFSMVLTRTEDLYDSVKRKRGGKVEDNDIFRILDTVEGQTLIYCASPSAARKLAFSYCSHIDDVHKKKELPENDLPLVGWINENLSFRWSFTKCLQSGIGIHDGSMPKHITSSVIQYFNEGGLKYLFCTNTIIEGVNTSAKNVVIYDSKIGTRPIDYFDYSNIRGRAGRLMRHYVGNVINLQKPPVKEEMNVDFPFFEQDPISSEVLVNLEEKDVKNVNDNVERYSRFSQKDPELKSILINNGVSIEGQEIILERLLIDLQVPIRRDTIIWKKIDGKLYERLKYLFELCWNNLTTESERKRLGSKEWVVNKVVSSCYQTSINQMIEKDIEYRAKKLAEEKKVSFSSTEEMFTLFPREMQERGDKIIENLFAFQKNWLQYRAPKWINVVDSLQKYATKTLGLPQGDYSYVAEMIENEFVQNGLRILLEYGIPQSALKKIELVLQSLGVDVRRLSEDEVVETLKKNKYKISTFLNRYENDILWKVL